MKMIKRHAKLDPPSLPIFLLERGDNTEKGVEGLDVHLHFDSSVF